MIGLKISCYQSSLARKSCSKLSVSGGLKKRADDEWGLVGKKERPGGCSLARRRPVNFSDFPYICL